MKHLRRFNESINKEELQDFCDTYLAYLLDEDFSIEYLGKKSKSILVQNDLDDSEIISLKKGYRHDGMAIADPSLMFSWDDIKVILFHLYICYQNNIQLLIVNFGT